MVFVIRIRDGTPGTVTMMVRQLCSGFDCVKIGARYDHASEFERQLILGWSDG